VGGGPSCPNFSCLIASTVLPAEYGRALYLRQKNKPDAMWCLPVFIILRHKVNTFKPFFDHHKKKLITAGCSTTTQHESGAAIFKQVLYKQTQH
jgi:hypothetical protein